MNILITGVSSGIGRALADDLTTRGHRVFGSVRTQQKADEIAKTVQRFPMGRADSHVLYHTVYIPAVTFPLSNCYFEESQLRKA